jgi:hypothetical protein
LAFGSVISAVSSAIAIIFSPLAVVSAITSITLVAGLSKLIPHGDRKAMVAVEP